MKYTKHPFGGGYFRTKKGEIFLMDIFHQSEGTKLARKAKGLVNSVQGAKNATKAMRGLGNAIGGITIGISAYNFSLNHNIRDAVDVSGGILSYFYWEAGILYLYGAASYDTTIMNSQQMKQDLQDGVNPMSGTFNFQTGRYEP